MGAQPFFAAQVADVISAGNAVVAIGIDSARSLGYVFVVGGNGSPDVVDSPSIVVICRANRLAVVREARIGVAIDAGAPTSGVVVALTTDAVVRQDAPEICIGVPIAVSIVGVGAGAGGAPVVFIAQVMPDFFEG